MKKLIIRLSFILFIICGLSPIAHCFAQDKIVAVVNNDIITQKDLNDFINFTRLQLRQQYSGKDLESKIQAMKLDLIDRLVEDRLILQEAKRVGITAEENRVIARINEIKRNYRNDEEFQNALKQQGLVQGDIENKIREQFKMFNLIEYKIRSKINVSPIEVTNYYQNNPVEFNIGEQREFDSVNVNDKDIADEISASLAKGEVFSDVAKKYSLTINKLNVTETGQLKQDIESIVFKLNKDEYSPPVNIDGNYYIFKLVNITLPRQQNLSESRDRIYAYLFNKKMEEEMSKFLDGLKKQSYIKISQE